MNAENTAAKAIPETNRQIHFYTGLLSAFSENYCEHVLRKIFSTIDTRCRASSSHSPLLEEAIRHCAEAYLHEEYFLPEPNPHASDCL